MGHSKLLGALAAVAVAGFAVGATAQTKVKIGYATINDPQQEVGQEIAKRLAANPAMKLEGQNFPAGQIGSIPRMIEGLQFGTLEMMITPPGFLFGINQNYQVLDAPGIFDSVPHAHKAMNDPEFFGKYSKLADDKGIKMLSLYVYGPTSWASKKPIRTLADFKGVKVRVLATKMESAMVGKFGASGVPMPYTEVLPALQRGTIDACRSAITVMGGSKFFTVTKFITVIESGMIPSAVLVSDAFLKKLTADQRKFVETTVSGMSQWATDIAIEYGKRQEKLWKDNGAEVIRLSAADQKTFMDTVRPLGDEFLGGNDKTKDMYNLLKKSVERARM